MYLKLYIDFSNKYQKIVKNKLNYDVKMIIWDKYKHIYFYEKLISYIEKCIFKCDDCQTARWNIRLGRKQNFYEVEACNNNGYIYDHNCCSKIICLKGCTFKIKCEMCYSDIKYSPPENPYDIGWNPIEEKKYLNIECKKCNHINTKTKMES